MGCSITVENEMRRVGLVYMFSLSGWNGSKGRGEVSGWLVRLDHGNLYKLPVVMMVMFVGR